MSNGNNITPSYWQIKNQSENIKRIELLPHKQIQINKGLYIPVDENNFPDENFRKCILNLFVVYPNPLSPNILVAESIVSIDCSNRSIFSLLGISFFRSLEKLYCNNNKIRELDLSKNNRLSVLDCSENDLPAICLDQLSKLTELYCNNNKIRKLDLSNNGNLNKIECNDNELEQMIFKKSLFGIEYISCKNNRLKTLELKDFYRLKNLLCNNNEMCEIDISKNLDLKELQCQKNITIVKSNLQIVVNAG